MEIGELSAKYESRGEPEAIGFDSTQGWTYGQISTKSGSFSFFLMFLEENYPSLYAELKDAGGLVAAEKGTPKFKDTWAQVATKYSDQFANAQEDFAVETMYELTISRLKKSKIDLSFRTNTMANVIYSIAVMSGGPGSVKPNGVGCCALVFDALCSLKAVDSVDKVSDAVLIGAIYDQKLKRIDSGREYAKQPMGIRTSVRNRIVSEHLEAQSMLAAEYQRRDDLKSI